ncbi:MAG: CHRD domain-containing protein [Actinomycetota bacterium]
MGKRTWIVLLLVTSLVLVAGVMATSGSAGGRPLSAVMTGPEEVPPGDPDGSGSAAFTFNPGRGRVCFELEVANIAPAAAAHIHVGPPGVAGPVVVPLTAPTDGSSSGCVHDVDPELIDAIKKNPGGYYVNVHNAEFPPGAVRGQLSR